MQYIVTSSDIKANAPIYDFYERLREVAADRHGICYYKYPIAGGGNSNLPDITIADLEHGICLFSFRSFFSIDQIESIEGDEWIVNKNLIDSPLLLLEDYVTTLKFKYDKYRPLRGKIKVNYYVVFPAITRKQFMGKFQAYDLASDFLFADELSKEYDLLWVNKSVFDNKSERKLFLSVTQGAGRLNDYKRMLDGAKADKIGEAIKLIDTKIAYLDNMQHAAAVQIPDGPQRIRGMAGTGKTIILAMKAAFLHSLFPDKKVLYTFHTQSLYNQIRNLITRFYRELEDRDPNWDNLLVMHAWGGRTKEGVYSRACLRNSIEFLPFLPNTDNSDLGKVCGVALDKKIDPEYDFILMDEAQDFQANFYKLVYKLCKPPKRIIFAYDELQTLNKLSMLDTGELFGFDTEGNKLVDFSEGSYDGGIKMDFVLHKSYRNPLNVLMTAHAIGLGLYNSEGIMQIIDNKDVWKSIGYEVLEGELKIPGELTVIERPAKNSVSIASDLYSGKRESVEVKQFDSRDEELKWIAEQIAYDIKEEMVQPHDIVVTSVSEKVINNFFIPLQSLLHQAGVPSIIPGVGSDRDQFGEKGFVTLSTVYKAKGNEAFIVYVMAFDRIYNYYNFIHARNTAFTSISRSKGWCRITGSGSNMRRAADEIAATLDMVPYFKFEFPDAEYIERKLSQEESAQALGEKKKLSQALKDILSIDDQMFNAEDFTEEELIRIKNKLKGLL